MNQHHLVLEAATPIAHGDTHASNSGANTKLFMRQLRIVGGQPVPCPHVSENALRHSLLREPLADHLIAALGLERAQLPRAVVNLLYSGGQMGGASAIAADTIVLGHKVKAMYPALDLLGGSVDAFILPPGRLKLSAWLVAAENRIVLDALFPDEAGQAITYGHDLLYEETRTRGTGERAENQMIYGYEVLAAGARIAVELTLDAHTPDVAVSALSAALSAWNGYIGGQGRQGRGRMLLQRNTLPPADPYLAHIEAHRDAMRDGILTGTLGSGRVLCA